jgi:hypothetical protein
MLNSYRPEVLRDIDIQGPGLGLKGDIQIGRQAAAVEQIRLRTLILGDTHLEDVSAVYDDRGVLNLTVTGGAVDAQPVIRHLKGMTSSAPERAGHDAGKAESGKEAASPWAAVTIKIANLEKLTFDEDHPFEQVNIQMSANRDGWQRIHVNADVPEAAPRRSRLSPVKRRAQTLDANRLTVDFAPTPDGDYALNVSADNFGDTLEALGAPTDIYGGRFQVTGRSDSINLDTPLTMKIELTSVTMQKAPLVGQLLAALSIEQLRKTMSKSGLEIANLDGTLLLESGVVTIEAIGAHGGSLGLTTGGKVDFIDNNLDLQGIVVPLFRVSHLIGKIPLLKHYLLTDEGEGILSIPYTITGPFHDLQIDVKKGAVLKPGILTDIFGE